MDKQARLEFKQAYELAAPGRLGEPLSLFDALKIKRLLLDAMSRLEAFEAYREVLELGPHVRLEPRRLKSLLEAAKSNAVDLHILHEGGRRAICEPPEIIGPGVAPRIEGVSRTVFVACFENAAVHSRSGAIELGSELLFDIQGQELANFPVDLTFDPVVFNRDGYEVGAVIDDRPTINVKIDRAWTLMCVYAGSFGHWMIESLAKFLGGHRLPKLAGVPLLIDSHMASQHRESLELLGQGRFPIIEVPRWARVHVDRLWVASNWFYSPYHLATDQGVDPTRFVVPAGEIANLYRAAGTELDKRLSIGASDKNTFSARAATTHRRLTNNKEIEGFLKSRGFSTIFPEQHSFAEQARIIRQSRNIVIQAGSAALGLLLARPGTKVSLLSHPNFPTVSALSQMLKELGVDFKVVSGPFEQQVAPYLDRSDYQIPLNRLKEAIEPWTEFAPEC